MDDTRYVKRCAVSPACVHDRSMQRSIRCTVLYREDKPRALPATYVIRSMTTGYTRMHRHKRDNTMMRFAPARCFGCAIHDAPHHVN